jgi:hypothetical protein
MNSNQLPRNPRVAAALQLAGELPRGARVVTLLCDRAERYFSTPLFDETNAAEAQGSTG